MRLISRSNETDYVRWCSRRRRAERGGGRRAIFIKFSRARVNGVYRNSRVIFSVFSFPVGFIEISNFYTFLRKFVLRCLTYANKQRNGNAFDVKVITCNEIFHSTVTVMMTARGRSSLLEFDIITV